jgi:hypothetical protein
VINEPREARCRELRRRANLHAEAALDLFRAAMELERESKFGVRADGLREHSGRHRVRSIECLAEAGALDAWGRQDEQFY